MSKVELSSFLSRTPIGEMMSKTTGVNTNARIIIDTDNPEELQCEISMGPASVGPYASMEAVQFGMWVNEDNLRNQISQETSGQVVIDLPDVSHSIGAYRARGPLRAFVETVMKREQAAKTLQKQQDQQSL